MRNKIIQYGSLAGWPHALALALRKKGFNAENVIAENADLQGVAAASGSKRQLPFDRALSSVKQWKVMKLLVRIGFTLEAMLTAKVVHYHGHTILPFALDALLFRLAKIPTVITWGGGDSRIISIAASINPYFFRFEEPSKDRAIRRNLARLSRYGVTVSTDPEMALYMQGFFENVHTFRAPIDLANLTLAYPSLDNDVPTFLHIPTHPFVKGTVHIRYAFKRLQDEGYKFKPMLLDAHFSQIEMRKIISECDVYVDELRCGSYGYTALEAAGSGKPTMTFICDAALAGFPREIPFINTHADNLYENLKLLIVNPQLRHDIGVRSREYVETQHSSCKVAGEMIELYRSLGAKI